MTAPRPATVVLVEFADDLLTLNRVMGIVRRRNLTVASAALGPGQGPARRTLTLVLNDEPATVSRLVNHLRKTSGVVDATARPAADCRTRELLLVRVRVAPVHLAALLDVAALYETRILEESPEELLLEASGDEPLLGALLRALEPFGVLAWTRSGALALPRAPQPATAPRPAAAPRAASAVVA